MRALAAGLLVCILGCAAADARSLSGVVTHVTDGDTLWVRPAGGAPLKVRIRGLDAPEICQAFGVQARDALAARVLQRQVRVETRARDRYHRIIGNVSVDGHDVGASLVAAGFAWSSGYRGRGGPYALEELRARGSRAGLWAAPALEPRLFRQRHGSCKAH